MSSLRRLYSITIPFFSFVTLFGCHLTQAARYAIEMMLHEAIPPLVCFGVSLQPHYEDGKTTPRQVATTTEHRFFDALAGSHKGHIANLRHDANPVGVTLNFHPTGFHQTIPVTARGNGTTSHVDVFRQCDFLFLRPLSYIHNGYLYTLYLHGFVIVIGHSLLGRPPLPLRHPRWTFSRRSTAFSPPLPNTPLRSCDADRDRTARCF